MKQQKFLILALVLFILGSWGCAAKPENQPVASEDKEVVPNEAAEQDTPSKEALPLFSSHSSAPVHLQKSSPLQAGRGGPAQKQLEKTVVFPDNSSETTLAVPNKEITSLATPAVPVSLPVTAISAPATAATTSPAPPAGPASSPAASVPQTTAASGLPLSREGLNPLVLYDFEVTEERYEPYSSFSPDKMVAYWRVINSQVKSKEDNYKQAKIVLYHMKRKYPQAYVYNMDVNERYYSVNKKLGVIIPNEDQLDKITNY